MWIVLVESHQSRVARQIRDECQTLDVGDFYCFLTEAFSKLG